MPGRAKPKGGNRPTQTQYIHGSVDAPESASIIRGNAARKTSAQLSAVKSSSATAKSGNSGMLGNTVKKGPCTRSRVRSEDLWDSAAQPKKKVA